MTALYQDTVGPSQHIYAYSQEMGTSATWSLPESSPLSACLGPSNQDNEGPFPSSPTSGPEEALFQSQDDPCLTLDTCNGTEVRWWGDRN